MKYRIVILLIAFTAAATRTSAELTVFAAASTTDVMKELAASFREVNRTGIRFNFASSGALARQIDAGAPADVFISAHSRWMDWLENRNRIDPTSRFDLAGNRLVLIAPEGSGLSFDGRIAGRLAVGDFRSVPSGMYAREALDHMGWLKALQPGLVPATNARTVMMYVERGEVAAGIVYATDALASAQVGVVGTFPIESHSPICYPAAACSNSEEVRPFIEYLKTDAAKAVLRKHGFVNPPEKNG